MRVWYVSERNRKAWEDGYDLSLFPCTVWVFFFFSGRLLVQPAIFVRKSSGDLVSELEVSFAGQKSTLSEGISKPSGLVKITFCSYHPDGFQLEDCMMPRWHSEAVVQFYLKKLTRFEKLSRTSKQVLRVVSFWNEVFGQGGYTAYDFLSVSLQQEKRNLINLNQSMQIKRLRGPWSSGNSDFSIDWIDCTISMDSLCMILPQKGHYFLWFVFSLLDSLKIIIQQSWFFGRSSLLKLKIQHWVRKDTFDGTFSSSLTHVECAVFHGIASASDKPGVCEAKFWCVAKSSISSNAANQLAGAFKPRAATVAETSTIDTVCTWRLGKC